VEFDNVEALRRYQDWCVGQKRAKEDEEHRALMPEANFELRAPVPYISRYEGVVTGVRQGEARPARTADQEGGERGQLERQEVERMVEWQSALARQRLREAMEKDAKFDAGRQGGQGQRGGAPPRLDRLESGLTEQDLERIRNWCFPIGGDGHPECPRFLKGEEKGSWAKALLERFEQECHLAAQDRASSSFRQAQGGAAQRSEAALDRQEQLEAERIRRLEMALKLQEANHDDERQKALRERDALSDKVVAARAKREAHLLDKNNEGQGGTDFTTGFTDPRDGALGRAGRATEQGAGRRPSPPPSSRASPSAEDLVQDFRRDHPSRALPPAEVMALGNWVNPIWCGLVDELRTVGTSTIDEFNHLVWNEGAAARAIEKTSSKAAVARALQEDPNLQWESDAEEPERVQVLSKAIDWLRENRAKGDPAAWKKSELCEGLPYYLQRRIMRGEPFEGTEYYLKGYSKWGHPPKEPGASAKKDKKKRQPPASPQEGVPAARCVNCGVVDPRHPDLVNCPNARVDVVRTSNELQLLAAFDAFKRRARQLKKEESSGSEHSLGSEDSYSEEEESDEDDREFNYSSSLERSGPSQSQDSKTKAEGKNEKKSKRKDVKDAALTDGLRVVSEDIRSLAELVRITVSVQATQGEAIHALITGKGKVRAACCKLLIY
jgi:hypothetical protein